ncbi:hypothetical protein TYRP_019572 [Tyrophagus putrescentiae]|nr:hypothetical protein TYRP_019572 [Tyrophagus putrescentiae]
MKNENKACTTGSSGRVTVVAVNRGIVGWLAGWLAASVLHTVATGLAKSERRRESSVCVREDNGLCALARARRMDRYAGSLFCRSCYRERKRECEPLPVHRKSWKYSSTIVATRYNVSAAAVHSVHSMAMPGDKDREKKRRSSWDLPLSLRASSKSTSGARAGIA